MKKIGFIDYYLDEWHANHYPQMIREASGGEMEVQYAYGQITSPLTGMTTAEWCSRFGVTACATIEELVEKSDCIVVLSPDNSEKHYELSHQALASGKIVYVDKTFADSAEEARRIFGASQGSPCFSSSALRFSTKLGALQKEGVLGMEAFGPGRPAQYLIHQLEPIAIMMGTQVDRVCYEKAGEGHHWKLHFADDRQASVNICEEAAFAVRVRYADGIRTAYIDDPFFERFIEALVRYFRTGNPPVEQETTASIMAIRAACLKAMTRPFLWLSL